MNTKEDMMYRLEDATVILLVGIEFTEYQITRTTKQLYDILAKHLRINLEESDLNKVKTRIRNRVYR